MVNWLLRYFFNIVTYWIVCLEMKELQSNQFSIPWSFLSLAFVDVSMALGSCLDTGQGGPFRGLDVEWEDSPVCRVELGS